MSDLKTTCSECGAEFLQVTADANGGLCLKCKPPGTSTGQHEKVATKVELSFRLMLAFGFAFGFAVAGYAGGALIWAGIGVLLAIILGVIGFVYGFFAAEINPIIRSLFSFGGD